MKRQNGYWIIVIAITCGAAVGAWFCGEDLHPSPLVRVLAVLLVGAWLLLLNGPLARSWQWVARYSGNRVRVMRDPKARVDDKEDKRADLGKNSELRRALSKYTWHLRHARLLVIGPGDLVNNLLPELTEQGYVLNEDALWLWHTVDKDGLIDRPWLKQLYTLRRRRPLDGVVVVFDSTTALKAVPATAPLYSTALAQIAQTLHWLAPIYALEVDNIDRPIVNNERLVGLESAPKSKRVEIETALLALRDQLAHEGTLQLGPNLHDARDVALSKRLDQRSGIFAEWMTSLSAQGFSTRGLFFSFAGSMVTQNGAIRFPVPALNHILWSARRDGGRPLRTHPSVIGALVGVALLALSIAGMLASAVARAKDLHQARVAVQQLDMAQDDVTQLRALLVLQRQIAVYETRMQDPLGNLLRLGLNEERAAREVLWSRYARASHALITTPIQLSLESELQALTRKRADVLQNDAARRAGYDTLKAYRMLGEPDRADGIFLSEQIVKAWPMPIAVPPGEWQDTSQRVAAFFADHLKTHPDWRITPSDRLIAAARNTLAQQIGLATTDEHIYETMLAELRNKYTDVSLAALLQGADAQGLFTTARTVPGIFTRAAWEGAIAKAIEQTATRQHELHDWVLADASADAVAATSRTREALKARLTAHYFADYAAAWQHMLNSIQWQPATNLNMAVDQLTRLTDAQTSPLIALMKSVRYEAQAGRSTTNLGDTLVHHARRLIGSNEAPDMEPAITGPLEATFGPLLALFGDPVEGEQQNAAANTNNRSLQSFLRSVTSLRLTLQKISGSVDAQAMAGAFAQGVFQGKLSELTQARNDAALTAAGLGSAWAGVAQALFVQPVESAWQALLQPAAASLNDLWRDSLAMPFNRAFAGRYPFFDTQADASLAEIGRFIRPGTGLLDRFLTTQLSGVLSAQGDQWIPNGAASSPIALDPAFLEAVQQLTDLGTHMYVQGEAGYRFDIMALPSPGITRSALSIDRHQIVYFNQREAWMPITWPGDGLAGGATLTWDTIDAGMRRPFDLTGDWAFLRALEKAEIQPLDSARYQVTWTQPSKESQRYVLRTQLGEGPLELLKLRGFRLPERIFATERAAAVSDTPAPIPTSLSHATLSP